MSTLPVKILQAAVRLYRFAFSPWVGNQCRFQPTCSAYALQALEKHGAIKGLALAVKRLSRCHPWAKCEVCDSVPERFAWRDLFGYKRRNDHP